MICQTVKNGKDCRYMAKNGCAFNGGECKTIVDKCLGCERVKEYPSGNYCDTYPSPSSKWAFGVCNFATHTKTATKTEAPAKMVNPLKASKRMAGKK